MIDQEHHQIVVNYINIIKLCSMDLAANLNHLVCNLPTTSCKDVLTMFHLEDNKIKD